MSFRAVYYHHYDNEIKLLFPQNKPFKLVHGVSANTLPSTATLI